jgi:hypothetical protein
MHAHWREVFDIDRLRFVHPAEYPFRDGNWRPPGRLQRSRPPGSGAAAGLVRGRRREPPLRRGGA